LKRYTVLVQIPLVRVPNQQVKLRKAAELFKRSS